jgi:hypothetical protein
VDRDRAHARDRLGPVQRAARDDLACPYPWRPHLIWWEDSAFSLEPSTVSLWDGAHVFPYEPSGAAVCRALRTAPAHEPATSNACLGCAAPLMWTESVPMSHLGGARMYSQRLILDSSMAHSAHGSAGCVA